MALLQDLRYALRGFSRNLGLTAAAVVSLAIGIGANTSIFSVASAPLLNPLPYQDAERLVILSNRSPGLEIAEDWFSTALYFPQTQSGSRALYVTVKSGGDSDALAAAIRKEIRELDADLPVYRLRQMRQWVEQSLARQRFAMLLLSLFALLALTLATIGVYGLMSYLVGQGTREIGIRMALGATEGKVLALVLRQGLAVALVGAAVGLVAALALGRVIQSLLFEVRADDPLTFVVVALALAAVALVASYLPARRAARTDPMASLRAE